MKNTIIIALACCLILGSCRASKNLAFQTSIFDKNWKLIELNGEKLPIENESARPWINLLSAESEIRGSGGCNDFWSQLETSDSSTLHIKGVAATKMACLNLNIENEFFKMLENTEKYQLSPSGELVFSDNKNHVVAVFKQEQ